MAKRRSSDATPDLFSHAGRRDEATLPGSSAPGVPPLPHLLPKDLLGALRRLADDELEKLFIASSAEMKRRGLMPEPAPPARATAPKEHPTSTVAKASMAADPLPITQGKLNAIRAALIAGVKPNTIARQFGVTPAVIKKAAEGL